MRGSQATERGRWELHAVLYGHARKTSFKSYVVDAQRTHKQWNNTMSVRPWVEPGTNTAAVWSPLGPPTFQWHGKALWIRASSIRYVNGLVFVFCIQQWGTYRSQRGKNSYIWIYSSHSEVTEQLWAAGCGWNGHKAGFLNFEKQ